MRISLRFSALMYLVSPFDAHPSGVIPAVPSDTQQPARLASLAWLAGCWERRAGARVVEEQWMRPRGRVMLGMSRTVSGDSVVDYEQLRISDDGTALVYHAQPLGQPPATFRTASASGAEVVFANPAHDFPQRIRYTRVGRDSVVARVEGTRDGAERGVSFPYARVACPE